MKLRRMNASRESRRPRRRVLASSTTRASPMDGWGCATAVDVAIRSGASVRRMIDIFLPPLQRDALDARREHRLPGGTGHLPLTVELELEREYRPGSEARLRACDEGHRRPAVVLHVEKQLVAVAADGDH